MHQLVHTSEQKIVGLASGPRRRDLRTLEAARRPGCRPTEFWSFREVLTADDEEATVTGVGAVTELPQGWRR